MDNTVSPHSETDNTPIDDLQANENVHNDFNGNQAGVQEESGNLCNSTRADFLFY